MNRYEQACSYFRVSPNKASHQVKCPCHADGTASLGIARGKTQDIIVKCLAGCETQDILNIICPREERISTAAPTIVCEYLYTDAEGDPVAWKRRLLPKSFGWAHEDAQGNKKAGLGEGGQAAVPLYNLKALAKSEGKRGVLVVEGEKDVEELTSRGFLATCNPEGASRAGSAYTVERWAPLAGMHVCIIPDNDLPGATHADRVASILHGMAASVKVLSLAGRVPEKGDISDFFASGGSEATLREIVAQTGLYAPGNGIGVEAEVALPSPDGIILPITELSTLRPRPITFRDWEQEAQAMTADISVIPTPFPMLNDACRRGGGRMGWKLGWHILLAGAPGFGKTTVALNCCVHAALKGKKVGFLSLEQGKDEIMATMLSIATRTDEKELEAIPGQLNLTYIEQARFFQERLDECGGAIYLVDLPRSDLKTVERAMLQMIEDGCQLIITDYAQRITVQGKPDDYGRVTDISNTIQGTAKQYDVVSLMLSQFNRGTTGGSYAPKPQGLKGSSALEDDAGQIIMINDKNHFRVTDPLQEPGMLTELIIGKNRYGPLVNIPIFVSHRTLHVGERT